MAVRPPRIQRTPCTIRRVRWSLAETTCDRCQQPAPCVWEVSRVAIDLDLEQPVLLLVEVSVHHCRPCAHFFRAQPFFLRPDATYTNRVVDKAVASVFLDGMAATRVRERLARDFWVRPSEASIRRWCRPRAAALDFDDSYQRWVVEEFSGVLCIDEVYQDRLALLVAVDPAGESGDRLVGYQLVHGAVDQGDVERFVTRLRAAGIRPEQVITDGSALYPAVLAAVWPGAVHQLCLFHETRPITKAVSQVAKDLRAALPEPPAIQRRRGRPPKPIRSDGEVASCPATADRRQCIAAVQRRKREGLSLHAIVRRTGHSGNTIRRWLKEIAVEAERGILSTETAQVPEAPELSTAAPPPPPWESWDQLRQFRQDLADQRYLLVRRPDHLDAAERRTLAPLLAAPGSEPLRIARAFVEGWYDIWRDAAGNRRSPDDAGARFDAWSTTGAYRTLLPLKQVQDRLTPERFASLSHYLRCPHREATNNGAERMGRQFRHRQAPHFRLRTEASIDADLRAWAVDRQTACGQRVALERATRCPSGKTSRLASRAPTAA